MNGLPCESGKNDCYWNYEGRCTSWIVTQTKNRSNLTRNWDSKRNCTLTQIGVPMCGEYLRGGIKMIKFIAFTCCATCEHNKKSVCDLDNSETDDYLVCGQWKMSEHMKTFTNRNI